MTIESVLNTVQPYTALKHAKEVFNGNSHRLFWEPEPSIDGEEDELARVISVEDSVGRKLSRPQDDALDRERDNFAKNHIRSCSRLGQR